MYTVDHRCAWLRVYRKVVYAHRQFESFRDNNNVYRKLFVERQFAPFFLRHVKIPKTFHAVPRCRAAKFVSFSCSFIKKFVGPLRAVEVGPRRAPKQAVGRGFTSVEAFESDWAGTSKMPPALPMVAIDSRTTQTPNKPRSPTCRTRPVPQFDRTVFHGTAVNA